MTMSNGSNSAAPRPYRAAAIQFEPELFAKERNLGRLEALTEEAARAGAKLIVHPEMSATGYCWASRAEVESYVEPVPGPTSARFAELAARYGCYVVLSFPEVALATGVYYNCAVLVGPEGVAGHYRKTHCYISEPKWAKDGDLGLPVFATPLGRIAITICMDAVFPETARVPALAGADVICFPTNWLGEKSPSPTWMARALENGVYFVAANRYGLERGVQFSGGSCVIDPDGTVQSWIDNGEGIVYAEVDPARAREKRVSTESVEDKLADRRPEAYDAITLSAYRWRDRDFHGLYGLRPLPEGKRSRIVACQFAPVAGDVDANLATIERFATEHAGADLIVFPELAASGPVADTLLAPLAAAGHGAIVDRLVALARQHDVHLIAGLVESEGDSYFNAAALIGPGGLVGSYRKLHLDAADRAWATPGGRLVSFDIPAGRVGVLIGYDAMFPEASTCLANDGCDLIAMPSLLSGPAVQPWGATTVPIASGVTAPSAAHFHLWRERARETSTVVAFANGAAPWMGWSGVFGVEVEENPNDQVVLASAETGSLAFELDTTNLETRFTTNPVRAKEIMAMRVPIWYDALQAPHPAAEADRAGRLLATHHGDD